MKLNDMIFVIENQKGTVETNFLLTGLSSKVCKFFLHLFPQLSAV